MANAKIQLLNSYMTERLRDQHTDGCTCNIDKFKILNINVSKQLNQRIQPDETKCRKANFLLDLISIKENPSHNFDMFHINELIYYLCIK